MSDTIAKLRDLLLQQSKTGRLRGLLDSIYGAASTGAEVYGSANSPMAPQHAAGLLGTIADFTPVVGDVKSAYEGVQAAREGDWAGAGLGWLGALPLVPNLAGGLKFYRGTAGTGHNFDDPNNLGGIFFTTEKEYAQQMADRAARRYGGTPVVDKFEVDYGRMAPPGMSMQKAKERGYDSVFAGNELIVWDKGRIKQP